MLGKFKIKLLNALSWCAFFALVSCGDDVTKVTNETTGLEVAASADSLGACDSTALGKMMFASDENTVYVCADSGWVPLSKTAVNGKNGADGLDGVSCTVKSLAAGNGYKVVCGGDSVGVILNGTDGSDGKNGNNGSDGKDGNNGTSCTVEMLSDSSGYKIFCGGDSVGVVLNGLDGKDGVNGCNLASDSSGVVRFACGTSDTITLYKAVCGGYAYDPAKTFCFEEKNYDYCDFASYDPRMEFCQDGNLYALCNGKSYDVTVKFCQSGSLYSLCGGKNYDVLTEYCDGDTVYDVKGEFTDARDGQTYKTVKIGPQIWMAENLNYDYNQNTAKSYCYNNSVANCTTYGRLYIWSAAMDSAGVFSENGKDCGYGKICSESKPVRGVCPEGWHLPDTAEWNALEKFIADSLYNGETGNVGYALKSTSGWTAYNGKTGGSDYFGFRALPAGYRNNSGTFDYVQSGAYFWSSTKYSTSHAYSRNLYYNGTDLDAYYSYKSYARSVRCVKD